MKIDSDFLQYIGEEYSRRRIVSSAFIGFSDINRFIYQFFFLSCFFMILSKITG